MSMFNDIGWTRRGILNNIFEVLNKSRTTRRNSRRGTGHSLDLEAKRSGMENQITLLKENGKTQSTWWWNKWRNLDTSSIQRCFSTGSWNPEEEQQGNHALQCGCCDHRTFISNNSLCKSAQYLRSSRKMVWRFRVWSLMKSFRKLYMMRVERSSTNISDFFGESTKECSARSWKQSAWSSTELRNTGNKSPNYKN